MKDRLKKKIAKQAKQILSQFSDGTQYAQIELVLKKALKIAKTQCKTNA